MGHYFRLVNLMQPQAWRHTKPIVTVK